MKLENIRFLSKFVTLRAVQYGEIPYEPKQLSLPVITYVNFSVICVFGAIFWQNFQMRHNTFLRTLHVSNQLANQALVTPWAAWSYTRFCNIKWASQEC
jgi:branched-subunit amino acid transport protein